MMEDDWPESWAWDFERVRAAGVAMGYLPGEAAGLAFRWLKARAACPWREEVAGWDDARREAWGRLAGDYQDSGVDWREAEEWAYREIKGAADGRV